jgi:hypothetical protein
MTGVRRARCRRCRARHGPAGSRSRGESSRTSHRRTEIGRRIHERRTRISRLPDCTREFVRPIRRTTKAIAQFLGVPGFWVIGIAGCRPVRSFWSAIALRRAACPYFADDVIWPKYSSNGPCPGWRLHWGS